MHQRTQICYCLNTCHATYSAYILYQFGVIRSRNTTFQVYIIPRLRELTVHTFIQYSTIQYDNAFKISCFKYILHNANLLHLKDVLPKL